MSKQNQKRSLFISLFFAFAFGSLLTSLIQQRGGSEEAESNEVVMVFKGIDQTLDSLPTSYSIALFEAQNEAYEQQRTILSNAAIDMYLTTIAAAEGITIEAAGEKVFDLSQPTDEEVSAFFKEHESHIGRPFFEVKEGIRNHLMQEKAVSERMRIIADLEKSGDLALMLNKPVSPVNEIATANYPLKGNPNAPIHLVEFADYQCPHCKHASDKLKPIMEEFGDSVKLTFMDFPINRSGISRIIAEGAYCAGKQGQFWPYHDLSFAKQAELSEASATQIAEELGLNKEEFAACLTSDAAKQHVAFSEQEAIRVGVRATPTLFINGRLYKGDFEDQLRSAISALIK